MAKQKYLRRSELPRSASNKQQSTAQPINLVGEAVTEYGSGPSNSTIVNIFDVAEVV
jgi:hypothetical protein